MRRYLASCWRTTAAEAGRWDGSRSSRRITISSSSAGTRATRAARSGTEESRRAICSTGSSVSNGSRPVSIS
jgi:hypothetical protein